jgi:hypothetical protein
MEDTVSDQATETEQRITKLEQALAGLQAEIDGYRDMFAAAARSPFTKQILAQLGIKLDPAKLERGPLNPGKRL